jgi:hypothetical protein
LIKLTWRRDHILLAYVFAHVFALALALTYVVQIHMII